MDYIRTYADISDCGRYRYQLDREWARLGMLARSALFVMLNPSTADANQDDPTIRRCVSFAKAWNYEAVTVVNLFAYRATKPKDLWAASVDDIHGPRNQEVIERAARDAGIIICAWGAHERADWQAEQVRGWIAHHDEKLHVLGRTKSGQPRHPLYLRADAMPVHIDARSDRVREQS